MLKTFEDWLLERKYQAVGGASATGAGASATGASAGTSSTGMSNGSGSSMTNGGDGDSDGGMDNNNGDTSTGDISRHHHHGIGIFPWWGLGRPGRRDCKYGKRKDGYCRKTPKKNMHKENALQPMVATTEDDPELNGLIKHGKHRPVKHRSPKVEKMFGVKSDDPCVPNI